MLAGPCTDEVYGQTVRARIASEGLEWDVLLTGGLLPNDPILIGLLQQADLLVLPSVSETFGLVLLEAWATHTPVLASRTSGATTLIDQGVNGLLFDLHQPHTFHSALEVMLNDSAFASLTAASSPSRS